MSDGITNFTRECARVYWAASGLTYSVLSRANVERLRDLMNVEMQSKGDDGSMYLRGTFRAGKVMVPAQGGDAADIRCTAWYFKGSAARQAVTFEKSGFIGFAGWSDDTNIQPIIRGFIAWVDEMQSQARGPLAFWAA